MELGFYLPNSGDGATRGDIRDIATEAEEAGFDSVWVADHIVTPVEVKSPYPFHPTGYYHYVAETPYLEPLTTLAFAAGVTERVKLVLSALIVPYRHPLATAKIAATVDVVSGGRLILAVGVGWMREEFEALGHDYFSARGRNTDEQLAIMRAAWKAEPFAWDGDFYRFKEVVVSPKPVSDPLPVWMAGDSSAALRRMARYGQGLNLNAYSPERVAEVLRKVEDYSEEADLSVIPDVTLRGQVLIADSVSPFEEGHIIGTPDYVTDLLGQYHELGVAHFGVDNRADGIDVMRRNLGPVAEVMGQLPS